MWSNHKVRGPNRHWRCKTCKKVVARRTRHNQPTGMECLGRSFELVVH